MKYYLVGANWSGEKLNEDFFRRGYWEMGWDDSDQPAFANGHLYLFGDKLR